MPFVSKRSGFLFSITAAMSTLGDSEKLTSCAHPPLDPEKIDGMQWLTPGSASHQALQSIVLNKTLIKALAQMTLASHTGTLEVYHSLLLKYCEKRNHFFQGGNDRQNDNNHNVGRQQATTQAGDLRYKVV